MSKTKAKTKPRIKTNPASAFLNEWEQQQEKQKAAARRTLRKACQQLVKLKVDIVTINYDGYGDSGTLDDPVALRNGQPVELHGNPHDNSTIAGHRVSSASSHDYAAGHWASSPDSGSDRHHRH